MLSQLHRPLWLILCLALLPLTLAGCSSASKPLPMPCPTCPLQRPPISLPQSCEASPILDPEPPPVDSLPEPPIEWTTASADLRRWVQDLTALVVQYAISQRERGDLLETRLDAACDAVRAQQ